MSVACPCLARLSEVVRVLRLMLKFRSFQVDVDEETLPPEEQKERKIMKLLLKIKNGTPPMRKAALRQITDKSREFGAGPLFNQILPLLMSPTLEDQVKMTSKTGVAFCLSKSL